MLYVLDEPSVGLHPSNVEGLRTTIAALAANGNSVVVVEHEVEVVRNADWVIELGPGAGRLGGTIVSQGPPADLAADPRSIIGPFLSGGPAVSRTRAPAADAGSIAIEIDSLYNLHDVRAAFPTRALTAVAGPSGAGKTAIVLDSLLPAARAVLSGQALPRHVRSLDLAGIRQVVQVDATPIGPQRAVDARDVLGRVRRASAGLSPPRRSAPAPAGRRALLVQHPRGQCPTCRGLGHIDLDVQYLPDITVGLPDLPRRPLQRRRLLAVRLDGLTIADVLDLTVHEALDRFVRPGPVAAALRPIADVGLGYLRLGEPTPSLSGGESQRLRIASRLRTSQRGALYVFDEPSTGLHPLDIRTLVGVFDRLLEDGATIVVIDHDLDLLGGGRPRPRHGPGRWPGRRADRRRGTPGEVAKDPNSVTGPYLAAHLG